MKSQLFMLLAFLLVLGGCSQEEWQNQEPAEGAKDLIVASLGGNDSRASIQNKTLIWSVGDRIAVIDEDGDASPFVLLEESAGSATGEFEGYLPQEPKGVLFPYTESNEPQVHEGVLNVYLPGVINNASESCNLPMWSTWNDGHVYFKHLVGLLAISLNDIPQGYNALILTTSNPVCGEFTADINQNVVVLAPSSSNTNESNKQLKALFENNGQNGALVYIPLPVGTYANINVSVTDGSKSLVLKNWTNKVVQRGKIYSASLTYVPVVESEPAKVTEALADAFKTGETEDSGEVVTAPEESTQVDLTVAIDAESAETEEDRTIVVPAAAEKATSDISLNFAKAPKTSEEKPLIIEQDAKKEVSEANNTLALNMPVGAKVENLVVKAPTTSAVLNGATYTKLYATTATNTLIVGNGTIIQHLTIGGGNIRIQKGGQITGSITNASDSTIEIVLEEGAVLDDSVELIGNFSIRTAAEIDLLQAIEKGGKIVLSENVTIGSNPALSHIFTVNNSLTLDLNGKSIVCEGNGSFMVKSSMTITDVADNTGCIKGAICASGGNLVINGGTFEGGLSIGSNGGSISVRGGFFKGFSPEKFVGAGYRVVEKADGYEVVKANMEVDANGDYIINTATGLREFAAMVDEGDSFEGKTVKLGADIDLEYVQWSPIGLNGTTFKGTFDGQGYSIKHLNIKETAEDIRYVGFFSMVESAVIKNLTMMGGEVSYLNEASTVNRNVGAIVGRGKGVTLINCHNVSCAVTVNCEGYFGGLIGYPQKNGSVASNILACTNGATIASTSQLDDPYICLGGISGGSWGTGTNYVACYNNGKLSASLKETAQWNYGGGIVGVFSGNNYIYGCYSDGNIEGIYNAGALSGDGLYSGYIYSSGYAGLASFIGNDIATNVKDVINGPYSQCVKTLNEGIQRYNWTATVPCEYTFVEGTTPAWIATKPSAEPGAGNNSFGNGGKF